MQEITHQERTDSLVQKLVSVWHASVCATHTFLSAQEINAIAPYVPEALREIPHLIIETNDAGAPCAFMGIADTKLEMLFVNPEYRGCGVGKRLIQHAMSAYGVTQVVVNEQNTQAFGFYQHMGFDVYDRSDIDEQGNPYPILFMKLS